MSKFITKIKRYRSFYSMIGLLAVVLISSVIIKEFRTGNNMITILRQASTLLVLSTGLTAVLLTGSMDLSVGAIAGLSGCICAQLLKAGMASPLTFPVAILVGIVIGVFNGFLVGTVKLPSFIATFGTSWVINGLSVIVMNGEVIFGMPPDFTWFGTGYIGFLPVIVIIALIIVVIAYILLQKTTFGRDIYSLGSNAEAAQYSAVPVRKTLYSAFIMSGITAGIAGLLMSARLNAADSTMGDQYGLQTVAAVVVGGTSMLGGEGGVAGTVIGSMLLTIIINVMNLIGVSSLAQPAVVGVVIIAMVLFDSYTRMKQESAVKKVKAAA